ncbi:pentatricopeptide repeat-containing protein At4g13650 [Selaginella moellendorffii]|nr:pentatricopeptide repeat-containing protein At4g13650 [Selaginella moellendorffii]|eukprot:XP_024534843.1 pentatricopeptide repeat-containing protein At4g13650 [Selaginella moellendorffii]
MIKPALREIEDALKQRINRVSGYVSLLQQCVSSKSLAHGKLVHAHLLEAGFGSNAVLGDQLIKMYSSCGSLEDARQIFERMPCKRPITFNFMISAFIQHGYHSKALSLFHSMEDPDSHTYSRILGACCGPGALPEGKAIHQKMLATDSQMSRVVQNALVNMYSKCQSLEDARKVFDSMAQKDVVSWNSIISAYTQSGHLGEAVELYEAMDIEPTTTTFACVLGACCDLETGKKIHRRIVDGGWDSDMKVQNALVYMYAKCGSVELAEDCFEKSQERDVVSWNTMIGAYVQNGYTRQAMRLFWTMDLNGIVQDWVTFTSVFGACESQEECRWFHFRAIATGFGNHVGVRNGLVAMYANCENLEVARRVFDGTEHKNMSSWTTMLTAYARRGFDRQAMNLYREMKRQGVDPDFMLFPTIVTACCSLKEAREIHAHITATGSHTLATDNALVTMYSNCGRLEDAKEMFDTMPEKNFITWTAMISACAQHGCPLEVIGTYEEMERQGVAPVPITLAMVAGAYGEVKSLQDARKFHERIVDKGLGSAFLVENSLMNMYGKCGSVDAAKAMFDKMKTRNVITWTTMVAAYARNARPLEALDLYTEMVLDGTKPSLVTFTCVLAACSHAGRMEVGQRHLWSMKLDYGLAPTAEHYACVVDLLGRAGWLKEAEELILVKSLEVDDVVWRALLSACKIHCDTELGGVAAEQVTQLAPFDTSSYVLLSNIHAELGYSRSSKARALRKRSTIIKPEV